MDGVGDRVWRMWNEWEDERERDILSLICALTTT